MLDYGDSIVISASLGGIVIHPDVEPIDHIAPYKRIELGSKDREPEPKWVPVDPVWQKLDFGPDLD